MKIAPLDSAHTELSMHAINSFFMKYPKWSFFSEQVTYGPGSFYHTDFINSRWRVIYIVYTYSLEYVRMYSSSSYLVVWMTGLVCHSKAQLPLKIEKSPKKP